MHGTQIQDFTKGNITRQLLVFAWPLLLSNLLQIVYNMVDMMVVGHALGKSGLSAVSVGGDVTQFLTFVAIGFSAAGQILIARYIGARQRDQIGRFVGTMTSFLLLCALVISAVSLVFQDSILHLMNTPAEAYAEASSYSRICMMGLLFIYGYNVVSAILRGMGDSKHPFIFISIAAILNLILDLLFVLVFDMGAGGAALATVISQGVSFLSCVFFLAKHRQQFELDIRLSAFFHWDRQMLGELVKLGTPMAIKTASVQFSKMFVNSWINSYGVVVSGFAGIANKLASISNLISSTMNTAGSTVVGQNIAAGEFGRVRQILSRLSIITLSVSTVLTLAIVVLPDQVFGLFTDDTAVLALAGPYIPIAVMVFYAGALRAVMNALINGSGNYKINFVTAILDAIVLRIGLALLFGLVFKMEHYGFWLGDAIANFTPFWIGLVFYLSGHWKKGKVVETTSS